MPLDPQAKALLQQMNQVGLPPLASLEPAAARQLFRTLGPEATPERVASVENRALSGPVRDTPVRVYRPDRPGPLPVVAYFHGGGFVVCDLDTHDGLCRALANASGSLVVSVDYRLAPEAPFPAAAEDCYAATRWLAEHAAELGGDPRRIAVAGDSAGGNLAAATALMARDRGGPALRFQLLIYPVTNHDFDTPSYRKNAEGYFLTREMMQWFWGHYLEKDSDGEHAYASPLRAADLSGLPSALVITAEYDPLRDEGEAYGVKLRQADVPVELVRYDGMIHGFVTMFELFAQGKDAVHRSGEALARALA